MPVIRGFLTFSYFLDKFFCTNLFLMHFCLHFYFVFFSVRKEFQASECHKSAFISTHPVNIFCPNLSNFNVASFTFSSFNFFLSQEFTPYKKNFSCLHFRRTLQIFLPLAPTDRIRRNTKFFPKLYISIQNWLFSSLGLSPALKHVEFGSLRQNFAKMIQIWAKIGPISSAPFCNNRIEW